MHLTSQQFSQLVLKAEERFSNLNTESFMYKNQIHINIWPMVYLV